MEETKKCPYCGEEILAVAKKCKHCGEWLEETHPKEKITKVEPSVEESIKESIEPKYNVLAMISTASLLLILIFVISLVILKNPLLTSDTCKVSAFLLFAGFSLFWKTTNNDLGKKIRIFVCSVFAIVLLVLFNIMPAKIKEAQEAANDQYTKSLDPFKWPKKSSEKKDFSGIIDKEYLFGEWTSSGTLPMGEYTAYLTEEKKYLEDETSITHFKIDCNKGFHIIGILVEKWSIDNSLYTSIIKESEFSYNVIDEDADIELAEMLLSNFRQTVSLQTKDVSRLSKISDNEMQEISEDGNTTYYRKIKQ